MSQFSYVRSLALAKIVQGTQGLRVRKKKPVLFSLFFKSSTDLVLEFFLTTGFFSTHPPTPVVQGRISPQRAHARVSSPLGGVTSPRSLHANLPNDGIPKPTCHTCAPLGPSAVEIGNLRFLLADVARAKRWSRFVSRGKEKAGSTQKRKITPSG